MLIVGGATVRGVAGGMDVFVVHAGWAMVGTTPRTSTSTRVAPVTDHAFSTHGIKMLTDIFTMICLDTISTGCVLSERGSRKAKNKKGY